MLVQHMTLVSFLLLRKNLGNLREFLGTEMVHRPPAKNCPYAYAWNSRLFRLMNFEIVVTMPSFTREVIIKAIESKGKRIRAVIACQGGTFKYK